MFYIGFYIVLCACTIKANNMKTEKLYLIVDHRGFDLCGQAMTKAEAEQAKKSFQECGIYCHMKECNENFILF